MNKPSESSSRKPVLGCIADDATGATDLALNLVQGGMRVVQILGEPTSEDLSQVDEFDAVVIALKTRSIPKDDAIAQSVAAVNQLRKLGIDRFYFKYCSTFDSTEQGNIGPVAEALMNELGAEQTIFCPAFPRAGRTVYRGHLFVGDQLLNESGLENHPLNPMTDANLVRFLSKQVDGEVGLIPFDAYAESSPTISQRLASLADAGVSLVITDACDNAHLAALASVAAAMPLVTGGSGLARFLPTAYRDQGMLSASEFVPELPDVRGRSLIIAGSCSKATNAQVQWMKSKCPLWNVDVDALIVDAAAELARVKAWALATDPAQPLLVASTALPDAVLELQRKHGVGAVADAVEQFLASVTKMFVDELGARRLVLAGGETSGAIVRTLGIRSLHIGPEICAGVPWTETIGGEPKLALALKSGNFGDEDLFQTALEMLS
jgi:uncharacterized protein YgbK (DUF1537 family)